jgi:hypothetical protein
MSFLAAGLIIAVGAALVFSSLSGGDLLSAVAGLGGSHDSVVTVASMALVSMRAEHADLMRQATAEMAKMVDGLAPEAVRTIETAHADLMRRANVKKDEIAAEEARIAAEPKLKTWAAAFYMSASESGLALTDLNTIVASAETADAAKDALIAKMAATRNAGLPGPGSAIVVGADAREKFVTGVTMSILNKTSIDKGERNEFSGRRLFEIARMSLELNGIRRSFNDDYAMIGAAMDRVVMGGALSSSDFTNILANVAHKAMLKGYGEADETFAEWTSIGTLSDFKAVSRVDIGMFPSLDKVEEGAEYNYAKLTDRGVTLALATYGKMFPITRQAIINDDLNAFTKVPSKMGRAAHRTVGNLVYAILTSNPVMADGVALFHANHGNLGTGAGSALGVTSLDGARVAMGKQTDKDKNVTALNIKPRFLLLPLALQGTGNQLMASQTEPGQNNANLSNRVASMAKPIADARLDVASATSWYLSADPATTDTIEVSYLNGVQTPTLEQREGWNVDGVEFKVRHDAGVNLLDSAGLYKGVGA